MIRVAQTRTQRPASPSGAAPADKPAVVARAIYGLAVGTYLDEERAEKERTKLVESTQLPSVVLMVTENDVVMYRLIMGAFPRRGAAERMAGELIERGLVDEARVVSLEDGEAPKR